MRNVNDIDIFSIFGRKNDSSQNYSAKMPRCQQGKSKIHNPKFVYDPRYELLDRQSPQSGTKFAADPRSATFSKSANPFIFPLNSAIRSLFQGQIRRSANLFTPLQMTKFKISEEFEYNFSSVDHAFLKIKLVNENMWLRLIDNSKFPVYL